MTKRTTSKQTCPVGVIFDPGLNTCATPDQSTREGSVVFYFLLSIISLDNCKKD